MPVKRIYLAGSAGDFSFANDWRSRLNGMLNGDTQTSDPTFFCISPFRGREDGVTYTPNQIVQRDLLDIDSCDLVVAELIREGHPYIGTSMEIYHAYTRGIPVVVWTVDHTNHYWIKSMSVASFLTLDAVAEHIIKFWGIDGL